MSETIVIVILVIGIVALIYAASHFFHKEDKRTDTSERQLTPQRPVQNQIQSPISQTHTPVEPVKPPRGSSRPPVLVETQEQKLNEPQPVSARPSLRRARAVELRKIDVEIAEFFTFYTSIDWHARSYKEPTGIPKTDWDRPYPPEERDRKTIPRYSTDKQAFLRLEERIRTRGIYTLYLQVLVEEDQDETTATLEQKCIAILKAGKRHRP